MISYTVIGIAKHNNPPRCKSSISLLISIFVFGKKVLSSVHFYYYLLFRYIEINNIVLNIMLTSNVNR